MPARSARGARPDRTDSRRSRQQRPGRLGPSAPRLPHGRSRRLPHSHPPRLEGAGFRPESRGVPRRCQRPLPLPRRPQKKRSSFLEPGKRGTEALQAPGGDSAPRRWQARPPGSNRRGRRVGLIVPRPTGLRTYRKRDDLVETLRQSLERSFESLRFPPHVLFRPSGESPRETRKWLARVERIDVPAVDHMAIPTFFRRRALVDERLLEPHQPVVQAVDVCGQRYRIKRPLDPLPFLPDRGSDLLQALETVSSPTPLLRLRSEE